MTVSFEDFFAGADVIGAGAATGVAAVSFGVAVVSAEASGIAGVTGWVSG